ncbi:glycosyltransferase family 39 protein [Actinospica robiniae]|uniref:glycosyltransferase family 39 protein n=1 Tax=Actinospica robiniae TaxID=304901 RepID=UPI0004197C43|nr:glycosyltransferase family 39 protein [Actinospica robiniae]
MSHTASPSAGSGTATAETSIPDGRAGLLPTPGPGPRDRRERLILATIVLLAAAMYGRQAAHAEYKGFYAMAARSMTTGWRAFLFGALDPHASISIDKIPGFIWPQSLSALVFGFHPWALVLPQVVEGVVTILALNTAVRRWIGPRAGLIAAGVFALTPVAASLFGKVIEDAALTCLLVLAAAAWQRAMEAGRLRWLMLCGLCVGLAFQAKMLQSWAVLPAFALAYLVAAPPRLRTRVWHTLAAGATCLAVSLSWVVIVTLTPGADRPYIDGSTNNSAFAMVFGYNGLARFGGLEGSAAGLGSVTTAQSSDLGGSGPSGWFKLFEHGFASQVGWLYPVAVAGALLGLWRRGRGRTEPVRAGALMWTGWLLTLGLALSAGSVPHSTYLVALAPPLAALSAYALVRAIAWYRCADSWAHRLFLPALTAVTLAWAVRLSSDFPRFAPGIALPLAASAATVVAATVVVRRRVTSGAGVTAWTAAASCALMLAVPAVWSLSVFDSAHAGTPINASAGGYVDGSASLLAGSTAAFAGTGKTGESTADMARTARTHAKTAASAPGSRARGSGANAYNPASPPATLDAAEQRLLGYLKVHQDGASYLMATQSWTMATPYILSVGASVLPMGGFSGAANFPQPQQFSAFVADGRLHYVLLTGRSARSGTAATSGAKPAASGQSVAATDVSRIAAEVVRTCQLVPGSDYGAVEQETAPLYRCR